MASPEGDADSSGRGFPALTCGLVSGVAAATPDFHAASCGWAILPRHAFLPNLTISCKRFLPARSW